MGSRCFSQPKTHPTPFSLLPVPGQFFELDVYHSDGTPLTSDQIFAQLEKIWNSSLQTNKEPVGILTSNHRNTWAKAYNTLIKGASRAGASAHQKGPAPGWAAMCLTGPLNLEQVLFAHYRQTNESSVQLGQFPSVK